MSRILIVEDEAHLAEGLRFNLEAEGHSVQITETGEGALKRLLKDREIFDALVLDVMLPGKDGFVIAHELRKAQNYTPLLMLTARRHSAGSNLIDSWLRPGRRQPGFASLSHSRL